MSEHITHSDAIQLGKQHLIDQHNAGWFALDTHHTRGECPDIICLVGDEVWQVEVKVSRSDLMANRDKNLLGIGHRRFFLVAPGVLDDVWEIPVGYGLWKIVIDESERPYVSESGLDPTRFEMTDEALAQTIKLYANDTRRKSKKEPTGNWKEVEELLAIDGEPYGYGWTMKEIRRDLAWTASKTTAFSKAARRNELPRTIDFDLHEHPWVFRFKAPDEPAD